MNFQVKANHFYLNDRKAFLNSGEIHYFRIKRELWDQHLQAACEAGLTTVSTYCLVLSIDDTVCLEE